MSQIILSLTVSDLDAFRRYREMEEMTLAQLLRQLRREEGPSAAMLAGSALHAILETPDAEVMTTAERDGHRFHFTGDIEVSLLPFREIPARREYNVGGRTVELRGRCDDFGGLELAEHKLTTSSFDAERYFSRYQWRAYLSLFGAKKITYNVFEASFMGATCDNAARPDGATDDCADDCPGPHIQEWEIRTIHTLPLYRYPELEDDLTRELGLYLDFAHHHLIAPRQAA